MRKKRNKKRLKILTYDGKELSLTADNIRKILFFGNVDLLLIDKEKLKEILVMPKNIDKNIKA